MADGVLARGGRNRALLVLAGLASDSFKGAPAGLLAALITLAILSGACVGRARMGIGWAENDLTGKDKDPADAVPSDHKSPSTDRGFMYAGLTLLLCMGGLLVVAAWWTVFAPHHEGCTLKWQANPQAVVCTQ
jgi:hypothetical protein